MRTLSTRITSGLPTINLKYACRRATLVVVLIWATLVLPLPHADAATGGAKGLPILLVHGIYDDGTALLPLQHALEAAGYRCYVPDFRPSDGHLGLADLAHKLRITTDQHYGPRQPIFVVGFSLGGLVARYYLEILGGAARCRGLVTVSTPHAGTLTAYLIGGEGARDLRPFSPFLRTLWRGEPRLAALPLTSLWNPADLVIFPSFSSVGWAAKNQVVFCSSHPVMIRSRVTIRTVLRTLARENPPAANGSQPRRQARPLTPR